jgi:lipoprotein-anchoring transpeptidase ErfK/SrfK
MLSEKTELMPVQHTQPSSGSAFALAVHMKMLVTILSLLAGTAGLAQAPATRIGTDPAQTAAAPDIVATQVALDRTGFSPGEIDGLSGANLKRALAAFQRANGLPGSGQPDPQTAQHLAAAAGAQPAFVNYVLRDADIAGPFTPAIPTDLVEQSKLGSLGYRNALEAIAERFHANPQWLQKQNAGAAFSRAGESIVVPNVEPFEVPQPPDEGGRGSRGTQGRGRGRATAEAPAVTIAVTKSTSSLSVEDATGRVLFHAPVTTGSAHDPLPIGTWKVTSIHVMPAFHYNPGLFWDADPSHSKATIKPGPNNPVGIAWIDLSKEHYGIHGTPEPGKIGHTESHGCVRLTNWDALHVAGLVRKGTVVIFEP